MTIRLRVSGERDRAVQLVRNLERFGSVRAPAAGGEAAQAADTNGRLVQASAPGVPAAVEFDILSGYNPLPEIRTARAGAAVPTPGTGASGKAGPR